MSNPPFLTFNFRVALTLEGREGDGPLCSADFWECDGLEMSIEPKTFREGGNNTGPIHLVGPTSYAQLGLKRGVTSDMALWDWFEDVASGNHRLRANGRIEILSTERTGDGGGDNTPAAVAGFLLGRCLPIKLRAPALNAKDGALAIEELQLVYETLVRIPSSSFAGEATGGANA